MSERLGVMGMRFIFGLVALLSCAQQVWAECKPGIGGSHGDVISIVDGAITVNGDFSGLAGIEVLSSGDYLSIKFTNVPGIGDIQFKDPFPASASVVSDTPGQVVIGVLGAENRIDIEGETKTSILYSQSQEVAQSGDLAVNLGIGDTPPVENPFGPFYLPGAACIEDGYVILDTLLNADFFVGIEVSSRLGLLSLETTDDFEAIDSGWSEGWTASSVGSRRVDLTAQQPWSLDGVIRTPIRYSGSGSLAVEDISIWVDADSGFLALRVVPESSSDLCMATAVLLLLAIRRRRVV